MFCLSGPNRKTQTCAEYSVLLLGLDNAGKTTLLNQIRTLYLPPSSSSSSPSSSSSSLFPFASSAAPNDQSPTPSVGRTVPTVGQNVATIPLPEMYLKIWDVGGQLTMRRLWQSYFGSCHAIVFVVDSTDVGQDPNLARLMAGGTAADGQTDDGADSDPGADADPTAVNGRNDDRDGDGDIGVGGSGGNSNNKSGSGPGPGSKSTTASAASPSSSSSASPSQLGRLDECRRVLESVLHHADTAGVPILVLANKQDREDCVEVVRIKEGFVRPVFEGEVGGLVRDSRVLPVSALRGTGVREAVNWIQSRVQWNKEGRPPVMR